jgi:CRISPR-associated exonuclease Cas4
MKPIERKRGDRYFENDVIQLCAYGLLLEEYLGKPVDTGILYLFGTNRRAEIALTDSIKQKTISVIEDIRSMTPDSIPGFVDNPKKCTKCSVQLYCLPYESHVLEGGEDEY